MRLNCVLALALLFGSATYAQEPRPSPNTVSRGPWPDALLLRGPGAQIGASFRDVNAAEAQRSNPNWLFGVVIEQVRPDSPASKAGIMKGDRITRFDGQRVGDAKEFSQLVEETPPGRTVDVTIVRDGRLRKLSITPMLVGKP